MINPAKKITRIHLIKLFALGGMAYSAWTFIYGLDHLSQQPNTTLPEMTSLLAIGSIILVVFWRFYALRRWAGFTLLLLSGALAFAAFNSPNPMSMQLLPYVSGAFYIAAPFAFALVLWVARGHWKHSL